MKKVIVLMVAVIMLVMMSSFVVALTEFKLELEVGNVSGNYVFVNVYATSGGPNIEKMNIIFKSSDPAVAKFVENGWEAGPNFEDIKFLDSDNGMTGKITTGAPPPSVPIEMPSSRTYLGKMKLSKGNKLPDNIIITLDPMFKEIYWLSPALVEFQYDVKMEIGSIKDNLSLCVPLKGCNDADCGFIDDGCGNALSCGICSENLGCIDNKCGVLGTTLNSNDQTICDAVVAITNTTDKDLVQGITSVLTNKKLINPLQKLAAIVLVLKTWLGI